jgi:N-acetylglucosaminyldiphosphoundecaprenol N-acetyl-beta-D-mannosaminyltransferase
MKLIITVNAEIIVEANRNPKLAQIINENWATFDGQWPYVLAKWKARRKDIEKISGSDFVYELCAFAAGQGRKVFLLGAAPEVNRESCRRLRRHLGVECAGYSPQVMEFPFPAEVDREILSRLESFRPDILVVCLGSPKQEFWADLHRNELECIGVRWVIGAGGTLDFIAGTVRRAPVLLQRMGLEGLWRLGLEPRLRIARVLRAFKFLRYA